MHSAPNFGTRTSLRLLVRRVASSVAPSATYCYIAPVYHWLLSPPRSSSFISLILCARYPPASAIVNGIVLFTDTSRMIYGEHCAHCQEIGNQRYRRSASVLMASPRARTYRCAAMLPIYTIIPPDRSNIIEWHILQRRPHTVPCAKRLDRAASKSCILNFSSIKY